VQVTALYLYPVKACAGIPVDEAFVAERGFALDRRWMVVDASGRFMTQRDIPKLALVGTRLTAGGIVLSAPRGPELELPFELETGTVVDVRIWDDEMRGVRHAAASQWVSEFLGRPASVVYMPSSERRPTQRAGFDDIVSFADAYPFLLISEASLEELNRRLEHPLDMRRFRPNIVISGTAPHAEDTFARVRIGDLWFRGPKRCDRCAVTTVDPDTGERGKEPLRTLATYRLEHGKVWFGMNLVHEGTGHLRIGDLVHPVVGA
jgi:uncharacterized protein